MQNYGQSQQQFIKEEQDFPSLGGPQQQPASTSQQPNQQIAYSQQQQAAPQLTQPQFLPSGIGGSVWGSDGLPQTQAHGAFIPPAPTVAQPVTAAASNPFGAFPAPNFGQDAAKTADAGGANPFATANPFNPATVAAKAFKPKVEGAIDMGDDEEFPTDFGAAASKKRKDKAALAEEARKKKEAEEAKLPTKGKPSSFFIMDYLQGDPTDPTGQCRLPNKEQKLFIFTHYVTFAQPQQMIMKIYELYAEAVKLEKAKEKEKEAYSKPNKRRAVVDEVSEEEIDMNEDTAYGVVPKKPSKKNNQQGKKPEPAKPKEFKAKDSVKVEEKKAASVAKQIKDIEVQPDENVVEVDTTREPCSLVFIGHVDAGKSTICGQLIYQLGIVDTRTIDKYKREAKDKGRDSWWLAYVMDNTDEEKAKGKTVEMGRAQFDTPKKAFTVFDAPGHKNYVPNMIMGAALADYGGLVISARKGEFEAGFQQDGQTREHIQLARCLGIQKLIIVVNKMDEGSVMWKKARWDEIRTNLLPFLLASGYSEDDLSWVPISGLTGQNITEPIGDVCSWYSGPPLIEVLDNLPVETRNPNGPLRIPVLDKMKETNRVVIHGKIEQGTVSLGDKLAVAPNGTPTQVLSILDSKNQPVRYARPGENVQVKLSYVDDDQVQKGDVLCPRDLMMPTSSLFEAELDLLDLPGSRAIFSRGYMCMIHLHTYSDQITLKDIVWTIEKDPQTGEMKKKEGVKFARGNSKNLVRIATYSPIALEKLSDLAALGRFTLRDEGKTIAIGRITRYIPAKKGSVSQLAKKLESTAKIGGAAVGQDNAPMKDKVEAVVFNMETGEAEQAAAKLDQIEEEGDDQ